MKLKQLLEQLNQLAKERPEALEMEVSIHHHDIRKPLYPVIAKIHDFKDFPTLKERVIIKTE